MLCSLACFTLMSSCMSDKTVATSHAKRSKRKCVCKSPTQIQPQLCHCNLPADLWLYQCHCVKLIAIIIFCVFNNKTVENRTCLNEKLNEHRHQARNKEETNVTLKIGLNSLGDWSRNTDPTKFQRRSAVDIHIWLVCILCAENFIRLILHGDVCPTPHTSSTPPMYTKLTECEWVGYRSLNSKAMLNVQYRAQAPKIEIFWTQDVNSA